MHENCLQSVLQFSKPRTRFQLSQQCPSLRRLEKAAPMYIKNLEIYQNSVIFDDTLKFCLHVFEESAGFKEYDLDEYGAMDWEMRGETHNEMLIIDRDEEQDPYVLGPLFRIEDEAGIVAQIVDENARAIARQALEKKIRKQQAKTLSAISRLAKIPLMTMSIEPRTYYIKFQIETLNEFGGILDNHEEWLTYDRKLHDAQLHVLEQLFSGRSAIKIRTLSVQSHGILRIPASFNITVNHLNILGSYNSTGTLNALRPLLEVSSLPLDILKVYEASNITNPIIENARMLIVSCGKGLCKFTNFKVKVDSFDGEVEKQITELLTHWFENGRPIGMDYLMRIFHERIVMLVMEVVKNKFPERVLRVEQSDVNSTSITLLMSPTKELTVTCNWDIANGNWTVRLQVDTVKVLLENMLKF